MRRHHYFYLKDYAVALATKVFVILMIIMTGTNQTKLSQQQTQQDLNNEYDLTDTTFENELGFSIYNTQRLDMNENLDVFVPSTPSTITFQSSAGLLSQSLVLQESLSSSSISTSPVTMATTKSPMTSTTEMNFISGGGGGVGGVVGGSSGGSTKGISGHSDYSRTTLEFFSSFAGGDGSGSISTKRDTTPTTIRPLLVPTLPELRHRITHARPYLSKHHHEHHWGPFFEEPLNVTNGALPVGVHLGAETYLNCRVGMLRDKTVIWIRRTAEKVSLLTVGNVTYSGDPRVSVNFQYPNNWRLHIDPVQKDDAGLYMCQVSTHPPRVFATNVTVLSAAIRVVDEHGHEVQDRYYKIGSLIDLTCEVAVSFLSLFPLIVPGTHPYLLPSANRDSLSTAANTHTNLSSKIDYYHQKIVWRKDNGSIPKDGYLNLSSTSQWRISRLTIPHADRSHSGIYSCSLLNSSTAVVHVQILNGEQPAAVQTGSSTMMNSKNSLLNLVLLLLIFKILHISC